MDSLRSSVSLFAPPAATSSRKHEKRRPETTIDRGYNDDSHDAALEDDADEVELSAEHESSVLRYFTTRLMLRYVKNNGDETNDGRETSMMSVKAPFLSVYESNGSSNAALSSSPSLLGKPPALVVMPPVKLKNQAITSKDARITTGVFTVIPAEGFEKEPGQPVFYNDPIELVDQRGRILGIVSRSPYAGQLAADGHGGALVFVFKRRENPDHPCPRRLQKCDNETSSLPEDNPQLQLCTKLGFRRRSTRDSVAEICGGDCVSIPGLIRVRKKPFFGGCVIQQQFFSHSSADLDDSMVPEFLMCEVVITSGNTHLPIDVNPLIGGNDKVLALSKQHMADRTATGEFVGVVHSGMLHRRTDHMKTWKKRFFVLTHVALHRFAPNVTMATIKTAKSRGDVLMKDCRRVRYEKFARPHELDIEFHSGKTLSMHSEDAVSCAKWASVLSYAIENPHWVHTDRSFTTIWRSDNKYESPSCPKIEKLIIDSTGIHNCLHKPRLLANQPRWNEKLSLGELEAGGHVMVQVSNGSVFKLSLEDISRALLSTSSSSLYTTASVDYIADRESPTREVSAQANGDEVSRKSTLSSSRPNSRFLLRLKYRAELQLDRRIEADFAFAFLRKKLVILGATLFGAVGLCYWLCRGNQQVAAFYRGLVESRLAQMLSSCQVYLFLAPVQVFAVVLVAPLFWHSFTLWCRRRMKEAKLQWFLSLVSLEMRPEVTQKQRFGGEDDRRSSIATPSEWEANVYLGKGPFDRQRSDDVYRFRLENALESILGRPLFSYFAIKRYFPNRFLRRDEHGRRVLQVSLNSANWTSLSHHNLSPFTVERYFFYLWEFIWSYSDFRDGVAHSELVVILDCSEWNYWSLFGPSIRVIYDVLLKTRHYYPGRLVKVVVAGNATWGQQYARIFRAFLPSDLRSNCILAPSLAEANLLVYQRAAAKAEERLSQSSADEHALTKFASALLSTYATVSIPSFTKREIDQATRFTKFGNLQSAEETLSASLAGRSTAKAKVGTKALLIPAAEIEWTQVYQHDGFTVCTSRYSSTESDPSRAGVDSCDKPVQVLQMRGTMKMKSTDIRTMLLSLQDPSQWKLWNPQQEEMVLLDTLSSYEDVCFWSRQIPFLNFSSYGNRVDEDSHTNAYFNCVVRRIYEERKAAHGDHSSYTILWKTTTSQQHIINSERSTGASASGGDSPTSQWEQFEDPFATVCYVLEPRFAPGTSGSAASVPEGITLSFWFQILGPRGSVSKLIEVRLRLSCVYQLASYLALTNISDGLKW